MDDDNDHEWLYLSSCKCLVDFTLPPLCLQLIKWISWIALPSQLTAELSNVYFPSCFSQIDHYAQRDLKKGLQLFGTEGNVGLTNAWMIVQTDVRHDDQSLDSSCYPIRSSHVLLFISHLQVLVCHHFWSWQNVSLYRPVDFTYRRSKAKKYISKEKQLIYLCHIPSFPNFKRLWWKSWQINGSTSRRGNLCCQLSLWCALLEYLFSISTEKGEAICDFWIMWWGCVELIVRLGNAFRRH